MAKPTHGTSLPMYPSAHSYLQTAKVVEGTFTPVSQVAKLGACLGWVQLLWLLAHKTIKKMSDFFTLLSRS